MDVLRTEMCTAFDVGTSRWKSLSRKRDSSYIRTDKLDARRNSDSRPPLHLLERFKRIESENRGVARNLETNLDRKTPSPSPFALEIPFETFDQLSRPTSPPRLGSSIDHPSPPPSIDHSSTRQPCQFSKRRPSSITIFTTSSKSYGFYRPAFNPSRITERSFTRDPFNPNLFARLFVHHFLLSSFG